MCGYLRLCVTYINSRTIRCVNGALHKKIYFLWNALVALRILSILRSNGNQALAYMKCLYYSIASKDKRTTVAGSKIYKKTSLWIGP